MYFIQFHGLPSKKTQEENPDIGGAYINCWILSDNKDKAIKQAKAELADSGWNLSELMDAKTVTTSDYTGDNKEGLFFYEQALVDKSVFEFHIYPVEDIED